MIVIQQKRKVICDRKSNQVVTERFGKNFGK